MVRFETEVREPQLAFRGGYIGIVEKLTAVSAATSS
jgi:hypothetical protein